MKLPQDLLLQWQKSASALGLTPELATTLIEFISDNVNLDDLLEKMRKVRTIYEAECTKLHVWLAVAGDLDGLNAFLENRRVPKDPMKRSIAHYLAWSGNFLALKKYIASNPVSVDEVDIYGRGVIHYLAWSGNLEALELFLEDYPERLMQFDKIKRTIPHYLAWSGNIAGLELFLSRQPQLVDEQPESLDSCLRFAKIELQASDIFFSALKRAIPLLKSRVVGQLEHHQQALSALNKLIRAGNTEAKTARDEALKIVEFKQLRPVIQSGKANDEQLIKLQTFAMDKIPGAQQVLDHYWWQRSLAVKEPKELEELTKLTPFAYLRLAEYFLAQSKNTPKSTSYFFSTVDNTPQLLQTSKTYLELALKHGTSGTEYLLGQWHLTKNNNSEACTYFYKAVIARGYFFEEALLALKNLADSDTAAIEIRCKAHLLQWRFNNKNEPLFAAAKLNSEVLITQIMIMTDLTLQEGLILFAFVMTLPVIQTVLPMFITQLNELANVKTELAVEFVNQSVEFFELSEKSDSFVSTAWMLLNEKQLAPLYQAVLLKKLLSIQHDKLSDARALWREMDVALRDEINNLTPYTIEITEPEAPKATVVRPLDTAIHETKVAAPSPNDDDDDDEDSFEKRWDCKN